MYPSIKYHPISLLSVFLSSVKWWNPLFTNNYRAIFATVTLSVTNNLDSEQIITQPSSQFCPRCGTKSLTKAVKCACCAGYKGHVLTGLEGLHIWLLNYLQGSSIRVVLSGQSLSPCPISASVPHPFFGPLLFSSSYMTLWNNYMDDSTILPP